MNLIILLLIIFLLMIFLTSFLPDHEKAPDRMSHAPYYDGRQCSTFLSFDHWRNYITDLITFHMNHTQQDETRFASFSSYRGSRQGLVQARTLARCSRK